MRTSIRSRLFLITYGLILAFILGLIILNNTYLERYYINHRENSLISAFSEIQSIDLDDYDLASQIYDVEENYNINVHILKEVEPPENIFDDDALDSLPVPYYRIYGNQMSMHDGMIGRIMSEFEDQVGGTGSNLVESVEVGEEYVAYLGNLESASQPMLSENIQMLTLCVSQEQSDDLHLYYILSVTFQSIRDSISVFNTFTIIIGFVFMIMAGGFMYLISYRFTNPILQINQVAQDISNLDFTHKVQITSNDEIGDLGRSINLMSSQLENAIKDLQKANEKLAADIELKTKIDEMRKEFIANASHELKTPISLIMGYSEALKLPGLNTETIDEYLNIIMDESNKMNKLVMELLKISQLESGFVELQMTDFSIKDLVEETIRLFSIMFAEAGIVPEVDIEDIQITSDYDALQTVLSNFIANAIHHIDKRAKIRVISEFTSEKMLRVSVYNSGKHIAESDIDRVWESFFKVDKARTRSYGGQGLGLSIARTTLINLGHGYGVRNADGGVEFFFEIALRDGNDAKNENNNDS
ncbi:MAG: HAMP domain-containing histidine kinase [Bacilli bacterium]|nr:HAMP domain-containing histidine kinase [Bacilli bacterium]